VADSTPERGPAAAFWDERHRRVDDIRSGGNVGYDAGSNEILYAVRLGRLIEIVGDVTESFAPLRMLDAGCGKGWFARAMGRFGHRVDGIDLSERAIELSRKMSGPAESYQVSALDLWRPSYLYDVVYSVDVLFHIMDDELWRLSVLNLASLVRLGGLLILTEHDSETDRTCSSYQRTRALSRYRTLLEPRRMQYQQFVPTPFRNGPVGFVVFTKVS
jgi:2-polyprenyl-3-methyl-5-hydroxy-6-metoxy-1,4-benzoquinol methylase